MRVVTSSLAIRFYRRDGWSLNLLLPLVRNTSTSHDPNGGTEPFQFFDDLIVSRTGQHGMDLSYWVQVPGTTLDIPKLMKLVVIVERTFDDHPGESDEEHLQRFNW